MKGYFSSLARQTGMRPTAQKAQVRKSSEQEFSAQTYAPLHQDETVMIAPTETLQHELKGDVHEQPPQPFESEKREPIQKSLIERESSTTSLPEHHKPLQTDENVKVKSPSEEKASAIYPIIHSEEFVEAEKTIPPINKDTQTASLKNPTEVFEENNIVRFVEQEETKPTANRTVVKESVINETQIHDAPLEEQKKDYFKLTNKLLESGTASRQEIHQTLLSEIQVWAAASPNSETNDAFVTHDKRVNSIVKPLIEQERVVLQEPASVRDEVNRAIEEQEFNLSIGNISIVIEEPPQSVINQPQTQRSAEKISHEEPQQFSRLSRYYI